MKHRSPVGVRRLAFVQFVMAAAAIGGAIAVPSSWIRAGDFTATLAPGEGTILQIGTKQEFKQAQRDYFHTSWLGFDRKPKAISPGKPGNEPYRLDYMPFGLYVADVYAYQAYEPWQKACGGRDAWQWYDQFLTLASSGGVNTIFVQGGGAISPPDQLDKFAALVARHGLKLIVQPDDAYFRCEACFAPGSPWTSLKGYKSAEDYYRRYTEPTVRRYLPRYKDNRNMLGWAPVEELYESDEKLYTDYKKLIRELDPNHLIVQLDSAQPDLNRLRSKRPPIPDLLGIDRYCWCHSDAAAADGKVSYQLWTPHYATRWLYSVIKEYADGVHKLYGRQAYAALQATAWLYFMGQPDADRYGWKADWDYVCPTAPDVRYHEALKLWSAFSFYFPPANAERLSTWLAVCAGFKGVFLFSALADGPEVIQKRIGSGKIKAGDMIPLGFIHYDMTTTPQWVELTDTWKNLKPFERLILSMEPSEKPFASSKEPNVYVNSFTDKDGRRFVVVVNGQIGEWDGYNPDWLTAATRTKLSVGMDGNLTGYTPLTKPRAITITIEGNQAVSDLRKER